MWCKRRGCDIYDAVRVAGVKRRHGHRVATLSVLMVLQERQNCDRRDAVGAGGVTSHPRVRHVDAERTEAAAKRSGCDRHDAEDVALIALMVLQWRGCDEVTPAEQPARQCYHWHGVSTLSAPMALR
jgi:hypothetical protein